MTLDLLCLNRGMNIDILRNLDMNVGFNSNIYYRNERVIITSVLGS
jgi:hypothetical protein